MHLSPGSRLGPYEIVTLLGRGGMGEVYRARDTRLKRDVALKVLPHTWTGNSERVARFQREAELLAALNHPGIAAIYGIEEGGPTALILELVEGPTLTERLQRGTIPVREAIAIARQIVDAFDAAHERGIVHRDLKPANLKIRDDGAVKVLDFGVAKVSEAATTSEFVATTTAAAMTGPGSIVGTVAYMSPEQARGQSVDKRTDIWAFGCVLYEMLAGRQAFAGSTAVDTLVAVLERNIDWSALPASTPPSLRRLIGRCLEKDRARRLRDIADAHTDLDQGTAEIERASSITASRRPLFWIRMLAPVAIVAIIGAIAFVLWSGSDARSSVNGSDLGPTLTRLVADASFSTEPALAPDGTLVVYASDRAGDGQLDLWLQRTTGGQPIRLTSDPADDREPEFSPDGSLIAFRSNRNRGGIYVIPALGGNPRLVAQDGRSPRFSPDGSHIAYWSGSWFAGPRSGASSVFVVPATGGQPTRIAQGFASARNPVWSPDGRALLFFGQGPDITGSLSTGRFDWWWAPLDGRQPVATGAYDLLTVSGLSGTSGSNTVTPTTDALPEYWTTEGVLFSARLGDSINLWRLRVNERSGAVIDSTLQRLTHGAGADLEPSPDGLGRIALQVAQETSVSLTLPLDPNTGKVLGAVVRHTTAAGSDNGRNSMDDAGRLLAYPRHRANESEVWLKDVVTGEERHLVTTSRSQLNPVMSHRGTTVAYTVPERDGNAGYVISVDGGAARKVCEKCAMYAWMPDDRRIFTLHPAGTRVRLLNVESGSSVDVLDDPDIGRVDVSPNGTWLSLANPAYIWNARFEPGRMIGERDRIVLLDKSQPTATAERPCGWSPDGRLVYLLLERDGFRDLYAQRVDPASGAAAGGPFVVQHLHDPRRQWGSTPYGTCIVSNAFVFNQTETTGTIWLLNPHSRRSPSALPVFTDPAR